MLDFRPNAGINHLNLCRNSMHLRRGNERLRLQFAEVVYTTTSSFFERLARVLTKFRRNLRFQPIPKLCTIDLRERNCALSGVPGVCVLKKWSIPPALSEM